MNFKMFNDSVLVQWFKINYDTKKYVEMFRVLAFIE